MKILLFTATGAENLGDELIALCEVQYLQKIYPDIQITLFSHDVQRTRRFLLSQNLSETNLIIQEYFPNALRKKPLNNILLLWQTITAIKQCQQIYIGGGGILYSKNEEGHSPLRLWSLRARLAKFFKKPITYLSIGVSTGADELRPFGHRLFSGTKITVRDEESKETLHKIWFDPQILPDPVLSYTPEKWENTKTVWIALRKWFISDEIIVEIIKKLIAEWYEILLLPHSLHPSDEASHDGYYLQNFLLPGVSTTQTIEQTLAGYKKCHIILSMRLHSMILSAVYHIPFIGLSYSKKTKNLLQDLDWKYTHDKDTTAADIMRDIQEIEAYYPELQQRLSQKHKDYQQQYKSFFPWI